MEQGNWNKTGKRRLTWLIFMISTEMSGCWGDRWQKKAMTGGGIQAKLWAENAVQYNWAVQGSPPSASAASFAASMSLLEYCPPGRSLVSPGFSTLAKLWAENAVQYNRITIMQPVRVSGWMSGWMEKDGVLSSFHFNVFSNSLRIRSPYAPPSGTLKLQRSFSFRFDTKIRFWYHLLIPSLFSMVQLRFADYLSSLPPCQVMSSAYERKPAHFWTGPFIYSLIMLLFR